VEEAWEIGEWRGTFKRDSINEGEKKSKVKLKISNSKGEPPLETENCSQLRIAKILSIEAIPT